MQDTPELVASTNNVVQPRRSSAVQMKLTGEDKRQDTNSRKYSKDVLMYKPKISDKEYRSRMNQWKMVSKFLINNPAKDIEFAKAQFKKYQDQRGKTTMQVKTSTDDKTVFEIKNQSDTWLNKTNADYFDVEMGDFDGDGDIDLINEATLGEAKLDENLEREFIQFMLKSIENKQNSENFCPDVQKDLDNQATKLKSVFASDSTPLLVKKLMVYRLMGTEVFTEHAVELMELAYKIMGIQLTNTAIN